MLSDYTIVCFSSVDWDFLWQGHQQIMSALAAQGNRVLFIETTGVRAPMPRDLPRLWRRLRGGGRGHGCGTPRPDNVRVYSPLVLPFPYSRVALAINRPIMMRAINRAMSAWGTTRPIVWNFLPTPLSQSLVRSLNPLLSVFHCVDHLAASTPAAARLSRTEAQCFAEADLVFATSQALLERARQAGGKAHLMPSGVDLPRFEGIRKSCGRTVPQELRSLSRPVIGYLGGVHQWVDQKLLASVAIKRPEWNFVLVGPIQTDASLLTRLPNVYVVGERAPDEVPYYLGTFDVATVPYRTVEYTHHVYPAKLNEYLAMGLGVVATPLAEIKRFNQMHGDIVRIGADAGTFEMAIAAVLAETSQLEIDRRVDVAQRNSWKVRLKEMSSLIEGALTRSVGSESCVASQEN